MIDTCRVERATDYVNAPGGRALYSSEAFLAHGIRLHFLDSDPIEYATVRTAIRASVSIIDLLMFNTVGDARALLQRYQLA